MPGLSGGRFLLAALCLVVGAHAVAAELAVELPPGLQVPAAAQPGPDFDAEKATQAYLALLTPEQRARSDAYYEGGYWVSLWQFLIGLAELFVILWLGWSARLRDWAERRARARWLQVLIYALVLTPLLWALTLPLSWYTDFIREHSYGLSNQDFGEWLWDAFKSMLVSAALFAIVVVAVYSFVRRSGGRWWIRATAFAFAFMLFVFMITPVFVSPLFNKYQPLDAGPVRDAVLSLARANEIPTDNVKWFDASKQTKRISANVSGLFGTTRVSLNDNLLERTSLPEIKAVLGHEMGHYVLHHPLRHAFYYTLLFGVGFLLLERLHQRALTRWGARWGVRERADPAGLPLALIILTTYFFVTAPLTNRNIYVAEAEADLYGLNAAREPHGFATVAMRLGAYRKLEPSAAEEFLLYDHPSGKRRVEMSMRWLAENQALVMQQMAASPLPPTETR
ncbi:MAG TPA: M48 family metallopeptidase [Steroidobacteraceae bacterium]|nr:M48 family metallopeptidase [Steroidobacteraceae bacterium]